MDWSIIIEVISLLFGGGVGAALMQLYTAKASKKKVVAEAESLQADNERKKQDNQQDAFDTMYQQLTKCMSDYTAISEAYREYREKMRLFEEDLQNQIHSKCIELADLKAKITYLKGIRCYSTVCPNRVRVNPDKMRSERI